VTFHLKDSSRVRLLATIFVLVLTFFCFREVVEHDFINLDDDIYVTKNPHVRQGLSLSSIVWSFTFNNVDYWHPLTWLSHMLDFELFGLNPGGHHLTNLLIHLLNSFLILAVIFRMTGDFWRSWFIGIFFALHPLHVESVAWVAERKDLLCALFWLLSLWAYCRYVEIRTCGMYFWVVIFLVLGLLAKPMIITLPCVLLLLDYWPLRRWTETPGGSCMVGNEPSRGVSCGDSLQRVSFKDLIVEKVPLMAISAAAVAFSFYSVARMDIVISAEAVPLVLRVKNLLVSYVLYIAKTFLPTHLAVFYPFPKEIPLWEVGLALVLLTGISAACVFLRRKFPSLLVGWLWFLGTLFPVGGLVQAGAWPRMADRFAYIPIVGLFVMITWGFPALLGKVRLHPRIVRVVVVLGLVPMVWQTSRQVGYWKDSETLYTHSLSVMRNNSMIQNNLGAALLDQGRIQEAKVHLRQALLIDPQHPNAHYNMGLCLMKEGREREAIRHFREAVQFRPNYVEARYNLANLLYKRGDLQRALDQLREALKIRPDFVGAYFHLGYIFERMGKPKEAIRHYEKALSLNPRHLETHLNLGSLLAELGQQGKALEHYLQAIRIEPRFAEAYVNLGALMIDQGRFGEAISWLQKAVKLRPGLTLARYLIGIASLRLGDRERALDQYRLLKSWDSIRAKSLLKAIMGKTPGSSSEPETDWKGTCRLMAEQ